MVESNAKMKGWLYVIRNNRLGLQYSRRRYFVLGDNCLKTFKTIPTSGTEEPLRSAIIDLCICVADNGRERHHGKVFFTFTIYNTSNHNDRLKLGVKSSEEAARWIQSLQKAAFNTGKHLSSDSQRPWQPSRIPASSMHMNAMASDVIAPSPWKIFSCQNGLRLFKEAKDRDSNERHWDDHPAIMAVGVVDGSSEAVFRTIMALGSSRTEWDFCFYRGSVVEHLDGHTDIIYIQLYNHWLPWGMKRRDFLLRRCWRREDDGTYVILYHSVVHRKCPAQDGYVRAFLKSGGYVITPTNQGKQCVVKHMLAVDWRFWTPYIRKGAGRSLTIHMVGKVAALREMYLAKPGNKISHEHSPEESIMDIKVPEIKKEIKTEVGSRKTQNETGNERLRQSSAASSLMELSETPDEFFDVLEPSDDGTSENEWHSNGSPEQCYVEEKHQVKLSTATNFMKKLHGLAIQKKGQMELHEAPQEGSLSLSYGSTLPKDASFNKPCSWAEADPSSFLIRGDNYLVDHKKIKAKGTLMEMVAADWLQSDKREDDVAGRYGSIVQKYAGRGDPEFFFVINLQVPGCASPYSLVLYYMMKTPLGKSPLLDRFVNGDDSFRNSRFKLIPNISKGSWIVKQSVGKKSCLIGQALNTQYFRGNNYLEVCIDVGSSTVAKSVVSLVLGYLSKIVIEMAFLIQGNTGDELPESLLGTCRLNYLDVNKSIFTDSIRGR